MTFRISGSSKAGLAFALSATLVISSLILPPNNYQDAAQANANEPGVLSEVDYYIDWPGTGGSASAPNNSAIDRANDGNLLVEVWVLPRATSANDRVIATRDKSWAIVQRGNWGFYVGNGATFNALRDTGVAVQLDTWTHLALLLTSTGSVFYVNGQIALTSTDVSTNNSNPLVVGNWSALSSGFIGGIDELRISAPSTTSPDIANSMHMRSSADDSTLRGYWDFNEGVGDTIYDRKNALNLTLATQANFLDVKTVTSTAGKTTFSFPRTYLPGVGGLKVDKAIRSAKALVVGGGGGGGSGYDQGTGGGGGAGGFLEQDLTITQSQILPVIVGMGGQPNRASVVDTGRTYVNQNGFNGQKSKFSSIEVLGGGGGGGRGLAGSQGASGGGGPGRFSSLAGGAAQQGNAGGKATVDFSFGGGGGGAGAPGSNSTTTAVGQGGAGLTSQITGITYARGGDGGTKGINQTSGAASPNSGNGGVGASAGNSTPTSQMLGGPGGSGLVVFVYQAEGDFAWSKSAPANKSQDFAYTSSAILPLGTWTTEMWFSLGSMPSAEPYMLFAQTGDSDSEQDRVGLFIEDGQLSLNNGSLSYHFTGIKLDTSRWYHVAFVSSTSAATIYLNGNKIYSQALTRGTIGSYFALGGARDSVWADFPGLIDQVKVWNGELSEAQVSQSMHAYSSSGISGPSLVAHYDFNEFSPGLIIDRSGNNRHLSILGNSYVDVNSLSSKEIISTSVTNGVTVTTFKRTYLSSIGGWQTPEVISNAKALVVGGGGGGGLRHGGGGGAGELALATELTLSGVVSVVVGQGGASAPRVTTNASAYNCNSGQASKFGPIDVRGGGRGGSGICGSEQTGGSAGGPAGPYPAVAGTKSTNSATTSYFASAGGAGFGAMGGTYAGGGGGGASGAGGSGTSTAAGNGGAGYVSDISGTSTCYAAGGGGGINSTTGAGSAGTCTGFATPIGGFGSTSSNQPGSAAPNTGSGGGGAGLGADTSGPSGAGGSGVIILRYGEIDPQPSGTFCDGEYTYNGLNVSAGHGDVFYIDTGQGQEIDAGYVAYIVKSSTARSDLWVEISGFNGGKVTLANPSDASQPLGSVTANGNKTAFFMLKATGATTIAQSHLIKIYSQKPTIGSPQPIYTCSFSFQRVDETIKAAANKVDSVVSAGVAVLGGTMTITVDGDTGTIGSGNDVDGRMIWLTPAARSNWPTGALRLIETNISFYATSSRTGTALSSHTNTLRVNATTTPALSSTSRQFYRAVYTFRVIGPAAATAPIIPVAMISSGTQIKHTDVSAINGGSVDITKPTYNLSVTKAATNSVVVGTDGTSKFGYTITLTNAGNAEVVIDEVVDSPDSMMAFVPGSAKLDGSAIADPGSVGSGKYAWSGPIVVGANSSKKITYDMVAETCKAGLQYEYNNTATARTGEVVIGSDSTKQLAVAIVGACGSTASNVATQSVALDPVPVTNPADTVTTRSATIRGQVDSNGTSGLDRRFVYSTNQALTSPTVVNLSQTTTATDSASVSATLSGLTAETTYYFQVQVKDATGKWLSGGTLSFTTDKAPGSIVATTDTATSVSQTAAVLRGYVNPNSYPGGAVVRYQWTAEQSSPGTCTDLSSPVTTSALLTDESTTSGAVAVFDGASNTYTSLEVTGLTPNQHYCYRIVAYKGSDNSSTQSTGVWVYFQAASKTQQKLSWTTVNNPLPAGGTTTVTAISNVSSMSPLVRYQSTDPSVCTVDSVTGVVTAVALSGICSITATNVGDATYAPAAPITISFPITPPEITTPLLDEGTYGDSYTKSLAANNGTGTYELWSITGGALPSGLNLDPDTGVISGQPSNSGIFEITFTVKDSNGITSEPRTYQLVINKVPLTVTASSHTLQYGSGTPSITATYAPLKFSDTSKTIQTSPNVAPSCLTAYTSSTPVASSPVSTNCSGGWAENYTFQIYTPGSISITPLPIVVRALNTSKENLVSDTNTIVSKDPTFSYLISPALPAGVQESDVFPGGITTSRTAQGTAPGTYATSALAAGEATGSYTITPSAIGSVNSNYSATYQTGTLTITEKFVPKLNGTGGTTTYSNNLTGLLNATATRNGSTVAGTFVYSYINSSGSEVVIDSGSKLPVGNYTVKVVFTPTNASTYFGPVETTIPVRVNPLPLVISAIDTGKQNSVSGSTTVVVVDPALEYVLSRPLPDGDTLETVFPNGLQISRPGSGSVPGPYATSSLPSGETAGTYSITVTGVANNNYQVSFVPGIFTITDKKVPILNTQDHTIYVGSDLTGKLNATANYNGSTVPGTFSYKYTNSASQLVTLTPGTKLPLGVYSVTVVFTPTDTTNYFGPVESSMVITVIEKPAEPEVQAEQIACPATTTGVTPTSLTTKPSLFAQLFSAVASFLGFGIQPGSNGVTQGSNSGSILDAMLSVMAPAKTLTPTKDQTLEPSDIEITGGTTSGTVEVTSKDGSTLQLLAATATNLQLDPIYTGAEYNNAALWQQLNYGSVCWKLEPFNEQYLYTLPDPIQLPLGTAKGEWEYSNVIVKAGSLTATSETYQTNTVFPAPKPGQQVWPDINANGIFDPGGKGDKAISHIVVCIKLKSTSTPTQQATTSPTPTQSSTPTPTQTSTPSPSTTPTPTQTPSVTPSPTQTATPTPTPTSTPTPTATSTPTPTASVTPASCPTPTIAPPTPLPTKSPEILILVKPLSPTQSATASPTVSPAPTSSPSPTSTPSPTPTSSPSPAPTTAPTSSPTATPTPTNTATPSPNPTLPPVKPTSDKVCSPDADYGVALLLTNGVSVVCYKTTELNFERAIRVVPAGFEEEVPPEGDLADTGFDSAFWVIVAMVLAGAGVLSLNAARRREE